MGATQVTDGFTLATGGDILVARASPIDSNAAFVRAFKEADVGVANLEVPLVDLRPRKIAPGTSGFFLTRGAPEAAQYLRDLGLRMLGFANNHSMDFGADGARETIGHLDAAGIVSAGFGETRSAARAAALLSTPRGRVALVSFTSSFFPGTAAADPLDLVPGAPGVSALGTTRHHIVPREQFDVLRAIDRSLNHGVEFKPLPTGDALSFRGLSFKVGERPDILYTMKPDDEADVLRAIRQGKQSADFLVASMHHHEEPNCDNPIRSGDGSAWRCQKPADFVMKIARAAVDNGADAFIGHGPHALLGIEIYKGRPIFYSLGNLVSEVASVTFLRDAYPADMDPTQTTQAEYLEKMWSHYEQDTTIYESVVTTSRFVGNRLAEIRLHPIDLGLTRSQSHRGTPRAAPPEMAQRVLKRLQTLSAPFGTNISIEKDVGIIRIAPERSTSGTRSSEPRAATP